MDSSILKASSFVSIPLREKLMSSLPHIEFIGLVYKKGLLEENLNRSQSKLNWDGAKV